jgi:predicted SprT family Zn-dependent metalloprotease
MKPSSQDRITLVGVAKSLEILPPYGAQNPAPTSQTQKLFDPTRQVCHELAAAFDFFNSTLFGGRLRPCLVTLQRHRGAAGYFAAQRFETRDGTLIVDEIALNPETFHQRSATEVFSTLVHEQVHALQAQYGTPSPAPYHNKQWAKWMERIGLIPSDTGAPGGRRTGARVSHYIDPTGLFARECAALIAQGIDISFIDRWATMRSSANDNSARRESKLVSKTRFRCPKCGATAWGKPNLRIDCRPCCQPMAAA